MEKSVNFRDTIAAIEKSNIKQTIEIKLTEEKIKKNNSSSIKDASKRSFVQSKTGTDTNSTTIINKERYIIGG